MLIEYKPWKCNTNKNLFRKKNTIEIQMDEKDSFEQIKMGTVLAFVFILLEFSSAQR